MATKLSKLRRKAFNNQQHRCHYCGIQMWCDSPIEVGLSPGRGFALQCTAEHLRARCDGGRDELANIVAACRKCNQTRHKIKPVPEPRQYREHVRRRVSQGRWHPASLWRTDKCSVALVEDEATWR